VVRLLNLVELTFDHLAKFEIINKMPFFCQMRLKIAKNPIEKIKARGY
jgi:hypothetical protein